MMDPSAITLPIRQQDSPLVQDLPPVRNLPPWFDSQQQQVRSISELARAVRLHQRPEDTARQEALESLPPSGTQWNWDWQWLSDLFKQFASWFSGWSTWHWILLLLLLSAIFLAVIFWILARTDWGRRWIGRQAETGRRPRAASKEELPFPLDAPDLPMDGLWERAWQERRAGNLRSAMIYLYSYLLIELDRNQRIRLSRGKTNRSYSQELRSAPKIREVFQATMLAFERVFFGGYELAEEQVDELFQRVRGLELT